MIHHGDCLEVMPTLDAESIDAIVTDPPYDLTAKKKGGSGVASVNLDSPYGRARIGTGNGAGGFMGKAWDGTGVAFCPETWAAAYRVAKPGAYLLAFGGTRTVHRLACAIEDAGWEIRDCLVYGYASGFPKSLDVAKASRAQSWAALLQDADRSSETDEGSSGSYRAGCRLCGRPLQRVSVGVRDAEPLSADAPRCSHPHGPSADIPLGNGRTYTACLDDLSCHLATPGCSHLAFAPRAAPVARSATPAGASSHTPPDDGLGLLPPQMPADDTPGRSSGEPPSEATPRRSDTPLRIARTGQTEAYTQYTLGCPDCHRKWADAERDSQGWGTALKPAWEPIVMARKPLRGTVAANVLAHGTGGLNIDGCRIGPPLTPEEVARSGGEMGVMDGRGIYGEGMRRPANGEASGRWPANVILTETPDGGGIFDGGWDGVVGGGETDGAHGGFGELQQHSWIGATGLGATSHQDIRPDGGGTYSRFFLIPKAARSDREPMMGGLEAWHVAGAPSRSIKRCQNCGSTRLGEGGVHICRDGCPGKALAFEESQILGRRNVHPTVKPVDLMRHLVRLVTPPGGTVLDPFLGSGSTAVACEMEGFRWIGIEKEAEYVAIAEARLNGIPRGLGLGA